MNWKSLWQKRKAQEPEQEPIKARPAVAATSITLDQWRKTEHLVSASKYLLDHDTYIMQMQVLENSAHPARLGFPKIGTAIQDRAAHQSFIEGYECCLNNLRAFAEPLKVREPLVSTFETPEDEVAKPYVPPQTRVARARIREVTSKE